jgi:hypothetical protein
VDYAGAVIHSMQRCYYNSAPVDHAEIKIQPTRILEQRSDKIWVRKDQSIVIREKNTDKYAE